MIIQGTGDYDGPPGFDRGMQTTQWCGNNPESWVRGSASLDTDSAILKMTVLLEMEFNMAARKDK
jgi:hypothetical protein